MRLLPLALLLPELLTAQTKVLVIGDSLSAEYEYSTPFSAPDSDELDANTLNWIEILDQERDTEIDFGSESTHGDLRAAGFKYNWGIPGGETDVWEDVFQAEFDLFDLEELFLYNSQQELLSQLDNVHIAVILLGGNDIRKVYKDLYDNTPPAGFPSGIINRYTYILDELRDKRPDLPLVIVNVPELGATPDIQESRPDPAKRAIATTYIETLNTQLAAVATTYNAQLVDFFSQTSAIITTDPYYIGSQQMIKSYDPENPPTYLFCKLKFHPASGLQAQLANITVDGINAKLGTSITTIPDREILSDVLGLNPDQAFLDWTATYPGTTPTFLSDDDADTLNALAEMALGTNPLVSNPPPALQPNGPTWQLTFTPDPTASRFVQTIPEESTNLQLWTPIPPARLTTLPDGTIEATLLPGSETYSRLRFPLSP